MQGDVFHSVSAIVCLAGDLEQVVLPFFVSLLNGDTGADHSCAVLWHLPRIKSQVLTLLCGTYLHWPALKLFLLRVHWITSLFLCYETRQVDSQLPTEVKADGCRLPASPSCRAGLPGVKPWLRWPRWECCQRGDSFSADSLQMIVGKAFCNVFWSASWGFSHPKSQYE